MFVEFSNLGYAPVAILGFIVILFISYPILDQMFSQIGYPVRAGRLRRPPQSTFKSDQSLSYYGSIISTVLVLWAVAFILVIEITLPVYILSNEESAANKVTDIVWAYAWATTFLGTVLIRLFSLCYSVNTKRFILFQFIVILMFIVLGSTATETKLGPELETYYLESLGNQPIVFYPLIIAIVSFAISEFFIHVRAKLPFFSKVTAHYVNEAMDSSEHMSFSVGHSDIVEQSRSQIRQEREASKDLTVVRWIGADCPRRVASDLSFYLEKSSDPTGADIRIIALDDDYNKHTLSDHGLSNYAKFVDDVGSIRLLLLNNNRANVSYSVGPWFGTRSQRRSNVAAVETNKLRVHQLRLMFDSWWDELK